MKYGLNFYYAGFSYYPITMLARLIGPTDWFISRGVTPDVMVVGFRYPFGGSQLQYDFALPKLAPNFPYGYPVEPDH